MICYIGICVSGGGFSCIGQVSVCGSNQAHKSSCKDCLGTTYYTCGDKVCNMLSCLL